MRHLLQAERRKILAEFREAKDRDEARALYLKYRGQQKVWGDQSWEAAVLEDFLDGLISREKAAEQYKVVINQQGAIDENETARLRL